MGKIEQGILGGFSGKVGAVVGSSWKGINYMRGKSSARRQDPTFKQEEQRARFQLMVGFIRKVSIFANLGFKRLAIHMTPINAALSYNLKNGITGTYPAYAIAYNMILVSRGDLPNAENIEVAAATTALTFTWQDNTGMGKAKPTDLCLVMAYCPALDAAICSSLIANVTREDQQLVLQVPQFAGETVQTYLSFFSADGKEVADSFYAGAVVMP
jgi:hypothetical protein